MLSCLDRPAKKVCEGTLELLPAGGDLQLYASHFLRRGRTFAAIVTESYAE